jgi:hypothetical protein
MDFIIANAIAKATEASETINQGRKITLFPQIDAFGNVEAKGQEVADNEVVQQTTQISNEERISNSRKLKGITSQIIPMITGIISVYLGWTCDTKKGVKGIGKFLLAILYFLLGGLHIIVYVLKWIFGSRCIPKPRTQ